MNIVCPQCKGTICLNFSFTMPASIATVLEVNSIKLYPDCLIAGMDKFIPKAIGYICKACSREYPLDNYILNFLTLSSFSGKFFKLSDMSIVTIIPDDEQIVDNKIVAIVPPCILGDDEVTLYMRKYPNNKSRVEKVNVRNIQIGNFN